MVISFEDAFPELTGKRKIVWATGITCKRLLKKIDIQVEYFIDNNIDRQKEGFNGKRVFSPHHLIAEKNDEVVVIIASQYSEEIINQLQSLKKFSNIVSLGDIEERITEKFVDMIQEYPVSYKYYKDLSKYINETLRISEVPKSLEVFVANQFIDIVFPMENFYNNILQNIPDRTLVKKKKLVFNSGQYFGSIKEFFMAFQVAKLGCQAILLIDDGSLYSWERKHYSQEREVNNFNPLKIHAQMNYYQHLEYKIAIDMFERIYAHENLKIIPYSQIINECYTDYKDGILEDMENNDFDYDTYVRSSLKRYFETDDLNDIDVNDKEVYELTFRNNAEISLCIGKYIKQIIKPDVFVTSHGIYSLWGPAYNYLKSSQVPTVIYGLHAHVKASMAISDMIFNFMNESNDWKQYTNKSTTQEERIKVDLYMRERMDGACTDVAAYFSNYNHSEFFSKIHNKIKNFKNNNKRIYCAFPNVIWDGADDKRNLAFLSIIDWLKNSVEIMKNKPQDLLLIRCHPAESTYYKTGKSIYEILMKEVPDIDKYANIVIIPPDERFNTYEFVKENIDVALIYNGFMGLEMPYLGIPTIVAGCGVYALEGINLFVKTQDEYRELLTSDEIESVFLNKFSSSLLYKYLYWYLYENTYQLPIIDPDDLTSHYKIQDITLEDVDIKKNPQLKRTMERVLLDKINFRKDEEH